MRGGFPFGTMSLKEKIKGIFRLFFTYLKIGLFTFGGGYAMIALIEDEIVTKRGWLTKEELTDIVTIAESTPGPIAVNCSTYVGYKMFGFWGSLFATTAVVLPSFAIIFCISLFFDNLLTNEWVAAAFNGIKCAVGLIILRTGFKMLKSFKKTPVSLICFFVTLVGVTLINLFAVDFSSIYFIVAGFAVGLVGYFVAAKKERALREENTEKEKK